MILYADDAVLFCDASTRHELQIALERELTEISNWYTHNRLTINVKLMLASSKMTLSLSEDFGCNQMVHKSITCNRSSL